MHFAIVLLAIGIAGSSAYGTNVEQRAASRADDDGRRLHASRTSGIDPSATNANATETRAVLDVHGPLERDAPSRATNQYPQSAGDVDEVGIQTDWLRARGSLRDRRRHPDEPNVVYFKVLVKPLVNLIWVAGIVFLLGALVALWPDAREQRRLVLRLAPARA